MEGSMLSALCYSFMWCTLYFTLCLLNTKRSYEWHCRTVTALHATTVSIMTAWCGFVQGPWPFTDIGGPNTPLQMTTTEVCLGYFMFDITWCLYFRSEGLLMLVHHMCSIAGMTVSIVSGRYGLEIVASIFGSELTNPLLQARWFLRETKRYDTWYGELVDVSFMFLFGFLRIFMGTLLLISYFRQSSDFLGRLSALGLYCISWLFWISIVQYGVRKVKKKMAKYRENREICEKPSRNQLKDSDIHVNNGTSHDNIKSKGSSNGHIPNQNGHIPKQNGSAQTNGDINNSAGISHKLNSRIPVVTSTNSVLRSRINNSRFKDGDNNIVSDLIENGLNAQAFKLNPSDLLTSCVDPVCVDPLVG